MGGSCSPIVKAYREYEPDFVYFICSKGKVPRGSEDTVDAPGDPCGDPRTRICPECQYKVLIGNQEGKAIVIQAGIPQDKYHKKILTDPDNLEEVYQALEEIDLEVRNKFPGAKKAVSYTGGTKTMTAGAVLFGTTHPEWELAFQYAPRQDLAAVSGGDQWHSVSVMDIYAKGQLNVYTDLLQKYYYSTVEQLIKAIQLEGLKLKYRKMLLRSLISF